MRLHRVFVRGSCLLLSVALAVSCGGTTDDDGGGAGPGKTGTGGGSGTGTGSTGSGTGGASSTGGTSAGGSLGTGAGGSVHVIPDPCFFPADPGECDAVITRYFHNPATNQCESFEYGGCGGNENNFDTLEECQAACPSHEDWAACSDSSQCILMVPDCCGACEPTDALDYLAINAAHQNDYLTTRACGNVLCEPCPTVEPILATSGYFVATCQEGLCNVVDLRITKATECETAGDCHLRNGSGCCEGCASEGPWISISDANYLSAFVCGADLVACPACVAIPPEDLAADCQAGRCSVALLDP